MIGDMLKPEAVFLGVEVPDHKKKSALKTVSKLCAQYSGLKENVLLKTFMGREKVESTGFGGGVAIPHAKMDHLEKPFIAIVRFAEPVEWDSIDGEPVRVAIALVMPRVDADNTHLQVLSNFSRKLADDSFIEHILNDENPEELCSYIVEQMGDESK